MGISPIEVSKQNHRINKNGIVERRCTKCEKWLEENTDNFYLHNKSYPERGFHSECKKCTIKRTKSNYDPIRHT